MNDRKTTSCIVLLALVYVLALINFGCSRRNGAPLLSLNPTDPLIGEYSSKESGDAEFRVTGDGGKYFVSLKEGDTWSNPEELVPCEEEVYQQFFASDREAVGPVGLRAKEGSFVLFNVNKGARAGDRTFETGYYVFMALLLQGDVYKL